MSKYHKDNGRNGNLYVSTHASNRANFLLAINDKPANVHQRIIANEQHEKLESAAKARGYTYEVIAREGERYYPLAGGFSTVQTGNMYVRISGFGREGLAELWKEVGI